jgi:hypothetical protein
MTPEEKAELFDALLKLDGPTMDFVVERSLETVNRDGLDVTISRDALEALHFQMITWVGTRLLRSGEEKGLMPQGMKVTVTVEFP